MLKPFVEIIFDKLTNHRGDLTVILQVGVDHKIKTEAARHLKLHSTTWLWIRDMARYGNPEIWLLGRDLAGGMKKL